MSEIKEINPFCATISDLDLMFYRGRSPKLTKNRREEIANHMEYCIVCCNRFGAIDEDIRYQSENTEVEKNIVVDTPKSKTVAMAGSDRENKKTDSSVIDNPPADGDKVTVVGKAKQPWYRSRWAKIAAVLLMVVCAVTVAYCLSVEQQVLTSQDVENLMRGREIKKAELSIDEIPQGSDTTDRLTRARYLYLQGRLFSEKSNFTEATKYLTDALEIANELKDHELIAKGNMILMNICHLRDENEAALEHAQIVYDAAIRINNSRYQICALQIMGLGHFALGHRDIGEAKLTRALKMSIEYSDYNCMARTYSYLGVVRAEQRRFNEALESIELSKAASERVTDKVEKDYLSATTDGYIARCLALSGQYEQAIEEYERALRLSDRVQIQQELLLSQYHRGLAESMIAAKRDQQSIDSEIAKAVELEEKAYNSCQVTNPLLTMAVVIKPIPYCH